VGPDFGRNLITEGFRKKSSVTKEKGVTLKDIPGGQKPGPGEKMSVNEAGKQAVVGRKKGPHNRSRKNVGERI